VDETVNPFPLEAVAAYGDLLRTCRLGYMREPLFHLDDYLTRYVRETTRYGGTIPLRGAHGSGKTHLLGFLAQEARGRTRSHPTVVYGMVDRASFFDLFSQIIGQLPQQKLQELIGAALQQLAKEVVGKAAITVDLTDRLEESPAALADLVNEGNIDRGELMRLLTDRLQQRMEEKKVPREIPLALMRVDSPTFGERAYQWLQGKRVEGLEELGLSHHLGELAQDAEGSSVPEVAAINAVETIAALHQFAQRPFVLLIDQLEVFVRDIDNEKRQMLASLIRKLMEQLGRQNALTFIAGADDGWAGLPRDVTPRMRVREPLPIGSLQRDETRMLLDSFTEGQRPFSRAASDTIYELSGGNPREILRIGYQAFRRLGGALDAATTTDLIASAEASGTVEDRTKVALGIADRVLGAYGTVTAHLDIGDRLIVDRLLVIERTPALSLVTVKATDQLSEVQAARRIPAITDYITQNWPAAGLIVVTIGYASAPVAEQLERAAAVIEFDEREFESQLRTRVVELLAQRDAAAAAADPVTTTAVLDALQDISQRLRQREAAAGPAGPAGPSGAPDPELVTTLTRIVDRLDHLEVARRDDVDRKYQSFAERATRSHDPEQRQHELRTRWDLLDELRTLREALVHGDPGRERECIRAILVANESFLKIRYLDLLGGRYLDLVDRRDADETSGQRDELIGEMRLTLRQAGAFEHVRQQPLTYGSAAGVAAAAVYLLVAMTRPYRPDTADIVWNAVLAGVGVTVFVWGSIWLANHLRSLRWRR
jgi:hypothetical protein